MIQDKHKRQAEIANLLKDKLGVRVNYVSIEPCEAVFQYGPRTYKAYFSVTGVTTEIFKQKNISVFNIDEESNSFRVNSFSRWMEGILNGYTRDESGEMVKPKGESK